MLVYAACIIVSILVLVDAALRLTPFFTTPNTIIGVSILVLVDAALRLGSVSRWTLESSCFNPCFSGCRPATNPRSTRCPFGPSVSILVLVDAALRLFGVCAPFTSYISFNPCFSGCRPATLLKKIMEDKL